MKSRTQAAVEGLKQLARLALAGIIANVGATLGNGGQITWRGLAIAGAIAILGGLDKYLHEDSSVPVNGLVPF